MSDREHCAFIALIDRLRAHAEREGDVAFAEALAECLLNISGGTRTVRWGSSFWRARCGPGSRRARACPRPQPLSRPGRIARRSRSCLKQREPFDGLRRFLEKEATRKHDARYLEALAACERITADGDPFGCPIRCLLREQGGGGLGPGATT
ncbi:MAG: hypothetical protein EPO64_08210 [Nitrospirae bacterium]|nr:MAG: hypothetical protein EPO64_08210 [Nitrospirota bacterium]